MSTSPITFSPDGLRFAYMRERHSSPFWDLLIAHSDGTPDRALFSNASLASPGLTSQRVAGWENHRDSVSQPTADAFSGLLEVERGQRQAADSHLSADRIFFNVKWLPDGNGLVMTTVSQADQPARTVDVRSRIRAESSGN